MLHSHCYTLCPSPAPCQLNWFGSPCICTVAAPDAGETEQEPAETRTPEPAPTPTPAA